jgi:hypothetical protein
MVAQLPVSFPSSQVYKVLNSYSLLLRNLTSLRCLDFSAVSRCYSTFMRLETSACQADSLGNMQTPWQCISWYRELSSCPLVRRQICYGYATVNVAQAWEGRIIVVIMTNYLATDDNVRSKIFYAFAARGAGESKRVANDQTSSGKS